MASFADVMNQNPALSQSIAPSTSNGASMQMQPSIPNSSTNVGMQMQPSFLPPPSTSISNIGDMSNPAPPPMAQQAPAPMATPTPAPAPMATPPPPQGSIEQGVLQSNNPQQISNFMNALGQLGAGSNNTFMNVPSNLQGTAPSPLISGTPNNGATAGQVSYTGAFNQQPLPQTYMQAAMPMQGGPGQMVGNTSVGYNGGQIANDTSYAGSRIGNNMTTQMSTMGANGFNPGAVQTMGPDIVNTGMPNQTFNPGSVQGNPINTGSYNPVTGQVTGQIGGNAMAPAMPQQTPSYGQYTNYMNFLGQLGGQAQPMQQQIMSDETTKENVKPGDFQVQNFLDAIKAHSYEYKDPKHGVGRFVSPMAQELEKTEIGKSAIIDTPEGKMVDYARLSGVMLAAQSMLNKRLDDIESQFRKGKK